MEQMVALPGLLYEHWTQPNGVNTKTEVMREIYFWPNFVNLIYRIVPIRGVLRGLFVGGTI